MQFFPGEGSGWLGVTLKDVTADMARDLKLPGEYGALVESVEPDSAAAKASLQKGDVIVGFEGERVRSVAQLRRLVRETPADRAVSLQVSRDGQAQALTAKLQPPPNQIYFRGPGGPGGPEIRIPETRIVPPDPPVFAFRDFNFRSDGGRPRLGISGDDLTTQLASYFGVKQGKGVLVREVLVGSAAAKAGLKAGDVIVAVDGKAVGTVAELRHTVDVNPAEEKRKLSLSVVRDRHELTVSIEVEKPGPGERERVDAGFGTDAAELQRLGAEVKAQLAAAQPALQDAQAQLRDMQGLMSDQLRRAVEEYRRAVQEQFKLQLQNQPQSQGGQGQSI
jgi:predicted metalloprotease with PDZ domain